MTQYLLALIPALSPETTLADTRRYSLALLYDTQEKNTNIANPMRILLFQQGGDVCKTMETNYKFRPVWRI